MLLKNKVAVIYGAGGAIGGAAARVFAEEGARLFLTGNNLSPVKALAKELVAAGYEAEAAEVDALDEKAIDKHLQTVMDKTGRLDISFNAISVAPAKILGAPLLDMDVEKFQLAITGYTRSYFLTARLAARRMLKAKSGVIMTMTAVPARKGYRNNGGYGAAQAAKEALTRDLSMELAPQGIRVLSLRPHGIMDSETMRQVYEVNVKKSGLSWEQFKGFLDTSTHRGRASELQEVADMAAFVASDRASGLTGTAVNMTLGALDD
jgi:NAD(P)-dependent dehydrogenase (short-subunit alcohol dehydrogenase family)